jgi:hypothetical protein
MAYQPFKGSTVIADVYANRPAAGNQGALFIPTDGVTHFIDNGVVWKPVIDFPAVLGDQPPAASNWTHIGSDATLVDDVGTLLVTSASANDIWQYNTALNATFQVDIAWSTLWAFDGTSGHEPVFGVVLRNNGTGAFVRIGMYMSGVTPHVFNIQLQYFTNLTTPSTVKYTYDNTSILRTSGTIRIRIVQDVTNLTLFTSQDEKVFSQSYQEAINIFTTPDHMGVFTSNTFGIVNKHRIFSLKVQ